MNPWLLLGAAIVWGLSCWYAYESGGDNRENSIKATYARQLETRISEHNEDALQDMAAAREWGESNGRARARADANSRSLVADIKRKPLVAACDLDAVSLELLKSAVADANNLEKPAASLHNAPARSPATSLRSSRLPANVDGSAAR